MHRMTQRVAGRWLAAAQDPCFDGTTSYAWIDPRGKVHVLSAGGHEAWADAFLQRTDPLRYQQEVVELQDSGLSPTPTAILSGSLAIRSLLMDGWIRVANPFVAHVYMLSDPPRKAWEALVDLIIECVIKNRKDPERTYVFLEDVSRREQKISVADFIERFGNPKQAERMYDALLA